MSEDRRILIAGGGPVGLLCALLLGRAGLKVRLFESCSALQDDPRAATTHPATLEVMDEAGLVEDMTREGLVAEVFQFWDRVTGRKIAEFDHGLLRNDTKFPYVVQCEQFKTSRFMLERLRSLPNVEILFDHVVGSVTQDDAEVRVGVSVNGKETMHSGAYLIGADGGRSTVRKSSGIAFEGFTWEERFLVLTTPFDFEAERGFCYRTYIADPVEWCNCFKVAAEGPPGLWRTVFPTDPGAPLESVMGDEAVQTRLQKFFPKATPYEVIHRNLYTTHQRVAATFRKGRVLLAGDSAHVNNSIGGMGLNGGLQDGANLSTKLVDVMSGGPTSLLDLYSHQRRTVTIEFVQSQTIANKKRLEARDPEAREKNFRELAETAADRERSHEFLLRSSMIAMQRRADSIALPEG